MNDFPMELPPKLRKNSFDYRQVLRAGRCYVYEQLVDGIPTYYEVFRAKERPSETFNGIHYPFRHVFPGDDDFGSSAWTLRRFNDKEGMLEAFIRLIGMVKENINKRTNEVQIATKPESGGVSAKESAKVSA